MAHSCLTEQGMAVPSDRFPYVCYLTDGTILRESACTAILFQQRWVLTAAHCVNSKGNSPLVRVTVWCGFSDFEEVSSVPVRREKSRQLGIRWSAVYRDCLPQPLTSTNRGRHRSSTATTSLSLSWNHLSISPCLHFLNEISRLSADRK